MNNWSTKKIGDCLQKIPKLGTILSSQYLKEGEFPVIDQGQDFIAGYTNDKSLIFSDEIPVVIFGDHTRALKYIDFPFAVGADGTKILKPIKDFDTKFFYFMLRAIELAGRGYSRHFSLLKEKEIPLLSLVEQKKIVEKLDAAFAKIREAKAKREEALADTDKILPSTLHEIFESGRQNGWEEKKIIDVIEKIEIVDPKKRFKNSFSYIDITSISSTSDKIPRAHILPKNEAPSRARKLVKKGDTIFATTRPYLKNIAHIPEMLDGSVASTGFCVLRPKKEIIESRYLFFVVSSNPFVDEVSSFQKGATYPAVSDTVIQKRKILLPPLAEQKKIVAKLDTLSEKVRMLRELQKSQLADLKTLEQSLLREAFNGELV